MPYQASSQDIQDLKGWLQKIPYLPHDLEDHVLATFYAACKGSLERTKQRIDNYYHSRLTCPDLVKNPDIFSAEIQQALNISKTVPLPKRTSDDSIVIFSAFTDPDPVKFDFADSLRVLILFTKFYMMENAVGSGKIIAVYDGKGCSAKHLFKMSPSVLAGALKYFASAIPYRVQGIHLLNLLPAAGYLISFGKAVVKIKLAQRVHWHSSEEELHKWIPLSMLPADYGGKEESLEKLYGNYRKNLESYASTFLEEEKKLQELDSLRPETDEDILVGTFRRLEMD